MCCGGVGVGEECVCIGMTMFSDSLSSHSVIAGGGGGANVTSFWASDRSFLVRSVRKKLKFPKKSKIMMDVYSMYDIIN